MDAIVKARGLCRRYGRFWALRDLDWELHSGEAVALLGANGAGKTTLLSMLCTLARPSDGDLQLMGMDPRKEPARVRAQIGYVAHHTLLDDALTARENLRYYGGLFDLDRLEERITRRLTQMGLIERDADQVEGFSRGMRQRLSLARALLHDPRLLVLDEPFTGLDAPGCRDLARALSSEKENGCAIVLATHQLAEVLPWCDRVLVLNLGRKVEEDRADARDAIGWGAHLTTIAAGGSNPAEVRR